MTKTKFRTQYNNQGEPIILRKNTMPSMTVPDQSMTIQEIQTRFASGIPLSQTKIPVYNGEEDMWKGIDPKSLDIVEINAIMRDRINDIKENKIRVEQEVAQRQEAAAKMKAEKEAKEMAQEIEKREAIIEKHINRRYRNSPNFNNETDQ